MGWKPTPDDQNAIHDNVAGEINAITAKSTPVSADLILIEDSAASFAKKKLQIGNLPGGGGGGSVPEWMEYLATRLPSETAHAADDFFDDDDHTAWTQVNIAGTFTPIEARGLLSLKSSGDTASDLNGMVKSIDSLEAPVTIETAVRVHGSGATGAGNAAIGFTDGTIGSSAVALTRIWAAASQTRFDAGTLTAFDSAGTNYMTRGVAYITTHLFLRCIWKSANTFRIMISPDGVSWDDIAGVNISRTITPTHFGLFVSNYGQGDAAIASYEYFRVYESDLSA